MKVCAIDIKSNKAIFVVLEKEADNMISDLTGKFRFVSLENDENHAEILSFIDIIHSYFQIIKADRIGIIRRSSKGKFSASPVSFKIEGLIQSYKNIDINFFAPQTIRAFYKKNLLPVTAAHNYQIPALELANFMLNQN